MIRVKKISHAVYETPDLVRQAEYYTDVLGLSQVDKADGAIYLGGKIDPHSIVLKKGSQARCIAIGFKLGADEDLDAFGKQVAAHGIEVETASDPEPGIAKAASFNDHKGTRITVFAQNEPSHQGYTGKGIQPHKLGHIAFHVSDVKRCTDWYRDVLGMRVSDWMGTSSPSCAAIATITRSTWLAPARTRISTLHSSSATGVTCRLRPTFSASTVTR
jgi:catechol 2,3-dioxygenase-like lactoylglutathione lyase family enzyme